MVSISERITEFKQFIDHEPGSPPRAPSKNLIEFNLIKPGDVLHDFKKKWHAKVRIDGSLIAENFKGSIHTVAANLLNLPSCNGWTFWYKYENKNSVSIDILREKVRSELNLI